LPRAPEPSESKDAPWWEGGQKAKAGAPFATRRLDTPLDKLTRKLSGRRSRTRTKEHRGRYIQSRPTPGNAEDLAFDATVRAAAPFQNQRLPEREQVAFSIRRSDFQSKVRVRRTGNLILFVVDASWSMAVAERMTATKGAILSLLTDAYQRRDRVGLIVFQKDRAHLVLPPTHSTSLARKALADIPVGGKTPLAAGLSLALKTLSTEKITHPEILPLMILLTDGAGNVSIGSQPPLAESYQVADEICRQKIRSVVVNMEHAAFDQGLASELARHLGASCYTLRDLRAESLYETVRGELNP
jgi:magnesium chelatase subunit D